jgi:poly(A) polymerase
VSETAPGEALRAVRAALANTPAWLVGGVPRDRALGRATADLDVVVDGSTAQAARAVARAAGGAACFQLSTDFSGWRVIARDHAWQIDLQPLRGGSLAADLALRDFTVNAIAEPLAGGAPVDPLDGLADLAARRLRMAGPRAFVDDPLRALRLVRFAVELGLQPEPETARAAALAAGALERVSAERVFIELRRIVATSRVLAGLELMDAVGLTAAVLPELEALRGIQQSRFHHRDVLGHTLEVLERVTALQADPAALLGCGALAAHVQALLAEPLADELTRGDALRWGALFHDAAKPVTRATAPDGRVTFFGHDARGAQLARAALERMRASERLRAHVAALVQHHLRLGFLVHEPEPLARRVVFGYLRSTTPVEVDVTLLSVADRLATRGDRAAESIDAHLRLARAMLADALRWRSEGPPQPLWRGDQLAAELGIAPGPRIGQLLGELAAAQYAGEVRSREDALAHARAFLEVQSAARSSP